MRHKMYGKDVREVMAQIAELQSQALSEALKAQEMAENLSADAKQEALKGQQMATDAMNAANAAMDQAKQAEENVEAAERNILQNAKDIELQDQMIRALTGFLRSVGYAVDFDSSGNLIKPSMSGGDEYNDGSIK
ncbi:hypothetical protein IV38_GL000118 [Lactobacillus selangorensis]|uniref:Uncharacterized protein n=2 Tax=Lactobacillus selangorensis TaxID=81857 RepID=A0A0R2G205_9LACO|nr:hypothetical protein IV38_GL000118 [Lactobacillus selangorensis]KRN31404.1 hypothetical protein IV40_GL001400 [Lactobacillus selangorensis]